MTKLNQEQSLFIRYYVQNEENFVENQLNTYVLICDPNSLRVKEIISSFPLNNEVEEYYLRFLLDDKRTNKKFWLDLPSDSKVPVINNTVYIKALRLGIKKEVSQLFNIINSQQENSTIKINNQSDQLIDNIEEDIKDLNFNINIDYSAKNDVSQKNKEFDYNLENNKSENTIELNSLVDSFAQQLISLMNLSKKNVVISPLSIFQVLSLLANGANGETLTSILKVLRQSDSDIVSLNNLNITFRNAFSYNNEKNIFSSSNALLFSVKPEYDFRAIASHDYDALVTDLKEMVNTWISKKSYGKIQNTLNNIPVNTNILIINTVYFIGEWKYSFETKNFFKDLFFPVSSSPYTVEYMKNDFNANDINYHEDEESQIIILPYKNPSLSGIIILPKTMSTDDYIKKVNIRNVLLNKFKTRNIKLSMPKFKIETNVSLKDTLCKMGMEICFTNKADFTEAVKSEKIFVSDVLHNTLIEINETGSEATSVTKVFTKSMSKSETNPSIEMKVNRPFVFLIKNSMIQEEFLFMAKIEKV